MAVQLTRRRFTVDEYYAMAQAGILGEDDRVELIDGEIVQMAPIGPGHAGAVNRLAALFFRDFGDRATVTVQNPIRLGPHDEPQPDIALARPRADAYRWAHPGPSDILLIIEVADTSLASDLNVKMPLYARADIQEAWVVDLQHELVLVHREPTPDGYRLVTTARRGERPRPSALPNQEIAVEDLLA